MITTAGRALINSELPSEIRDYNKPFDKKEIASALEFIADKYPTHYGNAAFNLKKIGEKTGHLNGNSFSLSDFKNFADRSELKQEAKKIASLGTIEKKDLVNIEKRFIKIQEQIKAQTLKEGVKKGNTLAMHVFSGARGNPSQLSSTITSPVMYSDQRGEVIPIPILNSLAEGLSPAEMFAGSYGTRKGVISTIKGTPEGGFFNKQVGYVAGNILITEDDCHTNNGIKELADDPENMGRVLAMPAGIYSAGDIIDDKALAYFIKKQIKHIVIRSPIACEAKNGLCKKCYGYNEKGSMTSIGDNVGINSSAALSEPFTQAAMNVKHSSGVIGAKKVGLPLIRQVLKIPKSFVGGSIVSEKNGKVDNIRKAPQGGFFVSVEGHNHYVQPGIELFVKKNDTVEKGDMLSDGIINPADITRLRGIGEGRKYLASTLKKAYNDGGMRMNKVHTENLAKAMINSVKIESDDEFDENVPGDIITLASAQKNYRPKTPYISNTVEAEKKYLAKPYLHYSIGTNLTKNMLSDLKSVNIDKVEVTDTEPPFQPIMLRLDDVPSVDDNFINRLYSIHLKSKLLDATHRGAKANLRSSNFIPSFIYGKDFGKDKVLY